MIDYVCMLFIHAGHNLFLYLTDKFNFQKTSTFTYFLSVRKLTLTARRSGYFAEFSQMLTCNTW
jgi:hypothetical protein